MNFHQSNGFQVKRVRIPSCGSVWNIEWYLNISGLIINNEIKVLFVHSIIL